MQIQCMLLKSFPFRFVIHVLFAELSIYIRGWNTPFLERHVRAGRCRPRHTQYEKGRYALRKNPPKSYADITFYFLKGAIFIVKRNAVGKAKKMPYVGLN